LAQQEEDSCCNDSFQSDEFEEKTFLGGKPDFFLTVGFFFFGLALVSFFFFDIP